MQLGMIVYKHKKYHLLIKDYGGNEAEILSYDAKINDLIFKLFDKALRFEIIINIGNGKIHVINGVRIYSYLPSVDRNGNFSSRAMLQGARYKVENTAFNDKNIGREKVVFN